MWWRTPILALAAITSSVDARALEGEWRAQLGAGAAHAPAKDPAVLMFAGAAYGVSDAVDVRAELLSTLRLPGAQPSLGLNTGVLFKLEITQWVPYVGVGVGGRRSFDPGRWELQLQPGLGVDYLFNRDTSFVLEYRPALSLLTKPLLEHQALLGFELRWGW